MRLNADTRVYVAGCGGMLGDAVYHLFFSARCDVRATDLDLNERWLHRADLRDHGMMRAEIEAYAPDVIINLGAITDLEVCERDPENAWATNAYAAECLGQLARERDIPYVYISTAGIFDGRKDFYLDGDEPVPLSVYGRSKLYGEVAAVRETRRHLVLRAGWMMGGGPRKDKKFINKIYAQIAAGARELRVVDDKLGTPTYTHDFARGMMQLLETDTYGLYNQAGCGGGSRYDVAVEFVRLLGLDGQIRVVRVGSDEFAREYFAPRPRSEQLINSKLEALGLNLMRDWRVCLREYVQEFLPDLRSRGL